VNPGIKKTLVEALGAEHVRDDDEALTEVARDRTELPEGKADCVVWPDGVEQIQKVLAIAREHKLPVVPVMANTNLGGLAIPVKGGIVLNLTRMNRILEVNEEDMYAIIEPGVSWQNMADKLDQDHPSLRFAYPLSPPETGVVPNCLLDGLANYSLRHGSASHWVNAIEAVLPTGELLKTGPFSYGSDRPCTSAPFQGLTGLFTSFQGTTGVVTRMSVQLWPRKKYRRRLFMMAYDPDHGMDFIQELIREDMMDDLGSLSAPAGKMLFGEYRPTYVDPNEPVMFVYVDLSSNFEEDFAFKQELVRRLVHKRTARGEHFDGPLDLDDLVRIEPRFSKFAKFPTRLDFLLDHKGGGLTWIGTYGPVSRFAEGFKRGSKIMLEHGLPPLIVARPMQSGHFGVLRWITVFDRDDPADTEKARLVNLDLADMALELGFFPYKTPQWVWDRYGQKLDPTYRKLVNKVKKMMDPDGIMNPGHLVLPE
jgi:FAD/FMN-containing dehydrogenase